MQFRAPSLLFAFCACTALVAAGCSSSSKTTSSSNTTTKAASTSAPGSTFAAIPPGPIKLGLSLSLSGPTAEHGLLAQKGLQTALTQFNQQNPNGIDGHQIVFDVQNDQGNTTTAVNVAKQFIDDHVTAVLEPSEDPGSQALQMQIWARAKLPVIGYDFGQSTYNNASTWPYVFSVLSSNVQIGEAGAKWIAQHPQYKKIAMLSDSAPSDVQWAASILGPLKTLDPGVSVVQTATMQLGAVDVSTQVAQLKAANPDLVMVAVGFGFGPVWNAFHGLNWAPPVLSTQNAYYDGYKSLGALGHSAVAPANDCIPSATSPIPTAVTNEMNAYVHALGNISVNMLIFVNTDSMVLQMVNYAVTKTNSTAPDAIKTALEGIHNQGFIGDFFQYNFSASNHFGLTGDLAAQVCNLSPLVGGAFAIPTFAQ